MKKITIAAIVVISALATSIAANTGNAANKKDNITEIETTDLCQAKGFLGPTPVKVTIVNDKILSIEALPNQETPRYFQRVIDHLLPQYKGIKVSDAIKKTTEPIPDGCTGATYSTRAVQQNINSALIKHKTK